MSSSSHDFRRFMPSDNYEDLLTKYNDYLDFLKKTQHVLFEDKETQNNFLRILNYLNSIQEHFKKLAAKNQNDSLQNIYELNKIKPCLEVMAALVDLKQLTTDADNGRKQNTIMFAAGTKTWMCGTFLLANLMHSLINENPVSDFGSFARRRMSDLHLLAKSLRHAANVLKVNQDELGYHIKLLQYAREDLKSRLELSPDPRLNRTKRSIKGFLGALEFIVGVGLLLLAGTILLYTLPVFPLVVGSAGLMIAGLFCTAFGISDIAKATSSVVPYDGIKNVTFTDEYIHQETKNTIQQMDEIIEAQKTFSPFHWLGFWRLSEKEKEERENSANAEQKESSEPAKKEGGLKTVSSCT